MCLRVLNRPALLIAIVASAGVWACGGDGDGGTGLTPTIDITLSATTLSVMQGQNGTVNVTLARGGGFGGAVALVVEGTPAGVTATAAPASIPTGSTSSVITLAVAASMAPGTYTLTVRATGQGVSARTASIALTVTAAPVQGFALAVTPTALSVQQGANQTATVTLTRTGGFSGSVNLTAVGLPAAVTAAFDPQSVTTNTSALTISVGATAAVGQATVTIRGAAPPLAEQTASLTLTVTAAPGGSGNTTWEFCSAADMPLWLAFQDGGGSWRRVAPTGTKFQFDIASANGGVAYVSATTDENTSLTARSPAVVPAGSRIARALREKWTDAKTSRFDAPLASAIDGFDLTIIYGTQPELNAQGTSACLPGSGKTVNGTVADLTGGQTALISLGNAFAEVAPEQSGYQLLGVPDGPLDLIATRGSFNPDDFTFPVDRIIIRRGLDQPDNSTLDVLDFNADEAFAPAQANLTAGNIGSDGAIVTTTYFTASGTTGVPLFNGIGTGAGPFAYSGIPTARQIAGDLHLALVLAVADDAENARLAGLFFRDPTDRTVTLGPTLPMQTVTVASTTPYVRLRAQGSVTADYDKFIQVVWDQTSSTVLRSASIGASSDYLGSGTTYDFTIPDFSATAGWNPIWAPQPGLETDWAVTGMGFTGIGLMSPIPMDGATIQGAVRMGTITP